MPDWTWLVFAAVFGAVSALSVPLALLIYFVRPFEKKPQVQEDYSIPVTLPAVSYIHLLQDTCTKEVQVFVCNNVLWKILYKGCNKNILLENILFPQAYSPRVRGDS